MLFKIGYTYYDSDQYDCQRHKMFFDKFPFEVNNTCLSPGESRDYDIFSQRIVIENLHDLINNLNNKSLDTISNTRIQDDLVLFTDPLSQKNMCDRVFHQFLCFSALKTFNIFQFLFTRFRNYVMLSVLSKFRW